MSEPQTGWPVIRDSLADYRPKDLFMQLARFLQPRVPPDGVTWPAARRPYRTRWRIRHSNPCDSSRRVRRSPPRPRGRSPH